MGSAERVDDYTLGRALTDSIRLDAQHLLWKLHTGYELNPQIPIKDDMKIAELGTGTGIWLFDLARQLPSTVQLHGYDISSDQFPPKRLHPQNVTLELMDSLLDPPPSLVGQYDVVHLRMWTSNVREKDTMPLISHIKRLLKPGGYIQWEDADLIHQVVEGDEAIVFEQDIQKVFRAVGLDYKWVSEIPLRLEDGGLHVIKADKTEFQNDLKQLCTNTYLLALREIIQGIKNSAPPTLMPSAQEREMELYELFVKSRSGIVYNWTPLIMLAQKEY